MAFRQHADANNEHAATTLANYNGSPFAVGGSDPDSNKVELYDISSNVWNDATEYPYHDL